MRANVDLKLINKEAASFFKEKKEVGESLFQAANHKFNLLLAKTLSYSTEALITVYDMDVKINHEIEALYDDIDKFEAQLEKRKILGESQVRFIANFEVQAPCSNKLALSLIEWLQLFDKLISTLKLLNLSGCFESLDAFYKVKGRYQKRANRLLSQLALTPAAKLNSNSIQTIIENGEDVDWAILYQAMQSSFCPGFSQSLRNQLLYKVKQKLLVENNRNNKESLC